MSRLLGITAVATVLGVACAGCSSKDGKPPPSTAGAHNVTLTAAQRKHIHLYTVAMSGFRRTLQTTGTVDYDNDRATSVLAPFSGPVTRLLVATGDTVKKGQPLAIVDSPDFSAAISAYRKALATAHTARQLADQDADLLLHEGVSRREAAQAQTDAANAEADRDAARQALVALDVDAKTIDDIRQGRPTARIDSVIRSPIAGTVVERQITPGQWLQAGSTPCFTVADLSRVWVMAQVFGADIDSVNPGDPADVATGLSAKHYPGTVTHVSAAVDPDTRSVMARVVVDNPGDVLKKRMYVRVAIHDREETHGLLVPVSAILRDDNNLPFVYLAQADGGFARRHVTLGYRGGEHYDITEGLHAGDKVVVEGGIFVQFMQNQ